MDLQDWPPHVIEAIQRQVSQFGRVGCATTVVTPDVPALLAAGAGAPTFSAPQTVLFRKRGIVIAMYGQELAGTAPKFASTKMKVEIGGSDSLFTDGSSPAFCSLLMLFGGAQNWYPLWRRVEPGVHWQVTYSNLDTGATATPSSSFSFLADADLEKMARGG